MEHASGSQILTITCPDTIGIVAEVAGYLRDAGYFIVESSHFGDPDSELFFMRVELRPLEGEFDHEAFAAGFGGIAENFSMDWAVHPTQRPPRTLIMVSRHDHCLNDLLYRYRTGTLGIKIPAIVSNHADLEPLAEWHDIPFVHLPVTPDSKADSEEKLLKLVKDSGTELVVLARYMQILSDTLCRELAGQVINIHHSFLPSFKGGRPYQQAHDRGVKLIGATAHYVTADLDEGPIIEQRVERVDHTYSVEELAAVGRDVESITLATAIRLHTQHRVFLNGDRTVILR